MENKNSFILYKDLLHTIKKMPKDKAGDLFVHILEYVNDLNPKTDDIIIELTFEPIKQQLKRDLNKWKSIVGKRSLAGKSSAEKRAQKRTNPTSVESVKQNPTNPTDSVSVSDSAIVSENNKYIKIKGEKFSVTPSEWLQQNKQRGIEEYMMANRNGVTMIQVFERLDSEFINYEFKEANHVFNAFKSVHKQLVKNPPAPPQKERGEGFYNKEYGA